MEELEIEETIGNLRFQMSQTDDDEEKAYYKQQIKELEDELEEIQREKKRSDSSDNIPVTPNQKQYKDTIEEDDEEEQKKKEEKDEEDKEKENDNQDEQDEQEDEQEENEEQEEVEEDKNRDKKEEVEKEKDKEKKDNKKKQEDNQKQEETKQKKEQEQQREQEKKKDIEKSKNQTDDVQSPEQRSRMRRQQEEAKKSGSSKGKGSEQGAKEGAKAAAETSSTTASTTTASAGGASAGGAAAGGGAAASGGAAAGGAATGAVAVLGWVALIVIIIIVILIIIIGTLSFFSAMPGMVIEKVQEFFNNIWDELQSIFIGADRAFVNDDDILDVAQYLHNMGYDLEGCGFVDRNGSVEFEKDENGVNTGKVIDIDSKYIWSYLVAENRSYLIRNYEFNFRSWGSELINSLIELEWPEQMNFKTGMLYFDDAGWWETLKGTIGVNNTRVDRESESLIIENVQGVKFQLAWPPIKVDKIIYSYSLKGWTGRYGKPLEFMNSMHLATMAPDLVYNIAMDQRLDAIVHIKRHKAKLSVTPYYRDDDGVEYTKDALREKWLKEYLEENLDKEIKETDEYKDLQKDFAEGKIDEKKYKEKMKKLTEKIEKRLKDKDFEKFLENETVPKADGSDSGMSRQELLDNMQEATIKNANIEIPYITWVENHWFRNVYFSYDGAVTIVENELAEDRKRWDKYDENGNLVTTNKNGVEVYDYNYNTTNEFEYDSDENEMAALGRIKVIEDIRGGIAQKMDGKRGTTNSVIKSLILDRDYYIYDGTVENAEKIKKKDPNIKKAKVQFTKDSLAAFSMLENTHTLDADYIYKDLKELLIELEYFEREDFIKKDKGVFGWFIKSYMPIEWPERRSDKEVVEYGTLIRSKSSIDKIIQEEGVGTIVNEGFEPDLEVSSPLTGKILETGVDELTGESYITIEVLDTGDIEEYKKYYYGEVKEVTLYRGTEDEEVVEVPTRIGYEEICAGYTMDIRGIQITTDKGIGQYIEEGDVIGKTTSNDICLIFRDLDNAIVENLEEYFYDSFISKNGQDVTDMFGNQISQQELQFFAGVLHAEAGASVDGCLAVAFSVYNRMAEGDRWGGPSLLGVLCAPNQYSTVETSFEGTSHYSNPQTIMYNGKQYWTKQPNANSLKALQMFLGGAAVNRIGNRQCFRSTEYYEEHNMNHADAIDVGGNTFFRS